MTEAYLLLANGKKHELKKETVSVGRVAENDIQVDDQSISRNHALMKLVDGKWFVEDLGSKNKTFVSEKPIEPNKPVELHDGQTLHFGYVAVKFHVKKAAQTGAETMAVDLNNPDIAAMFQEASQKSSRSSQPMGGPPPAAGVEEMRSSRRAYAYLELRSVTNPVKHSIEKDAILIGTDAGECDVRLIDSTAAPIHAEIRFMKGQKIQLKNMSQDSGTVLNGRRVGKAFIKEGDQIDIGDSSFTFHFVDWPDVARAKESGAATAAKFIIIVLLLVVAGGGGYAAYKMGYFKSGQQGTTATQVTEQSRGSEEALDLVTQGRYDEANGCLIRLMKNINSETEGAALKAMQAEVLKLREMKEKLDGRDFVAAYQLSKDLDFQGSQVANRAAQLQREVVRRYREAVLKAKTDYEQAEADSRWDEAVKGIDLLQRIETKLGEEAFEGSKVKLAAAKDRIIVRQDLQNIYTAAMKDMDSLYQQVIEDTGRVLEKAEAKANEDADLKNELSKSITKVQSAKAHAELLRAYFQFDGQNLDEARRLRNSIAVDYERRDDVNRRLSNLEEICRVYTEYLTLLNDFKDKKDPNLNPVRFYDQVIIKLETILSKEGDSRFELSKMASQDIARLREEKKKMLLQAFSQPVQGNFPTGIRGDLERSLAERQRWYEYLQLFSLTVRDNRYKPLVLSEELKDEEIVKRFQEAYDRYDKAQSETLKLVLRNWQETTDMALKKETLTFIDRLQSMTLPEDKNTEKAILAVKAQLR
jgi:pSer/pThr/pTyr-binding forkhead associated (FHA) protein